MKAGAIVIGVSYYSKQFKATSVWCMSIQTIDYIPSLRRVYWLIAKTEKNLCVGRFETVRLFEMTISWVCLNCCHIQSEGVEIREIRDNQI